VPRFGNKYPPPHPSHQGRGMAYKTMTILVVDDDLIIVKFLTKALMKYGDSGICDVKRKRIIGIFS
jgi:hypothetical protein